MRGWETGHHDGAVRQLAERENGELAGASARRVDCNDDVICVTLRNRAERIDRYLVVNAFEELLDVGTREGLRRRVSTDSHGLADKGEKCLVQLLRVCVCACARVRVCVCVCACVRVATPQQHRRVIGLPRECDHL